MKKYLVLVLAAATFLISCTPTFNNKAQSKMKGDWTISDVEYKGAKGIKVTAFDDADAKCFVGSKWFFLANNYTGKYTLLGSDKCPSGTTNITWFVSPENNFQFKKVFTGEKAKKILEGYELKLENQTETAFDLVDESSVDGKRVQIVYHFVKD